MGIVRGRGESSLLIKECEPVIVPVLAVGQFYPLPHKNDGLPSAPNSETTLSTGGITIKLKGCPFPFCQSGSVQRAPTGQRDQPGRT